MRTLTLALWMFAGVSAAAPLRLAIVYGHNGGTLTHPPLRFAQADATRVASMLTELAGVKSEDLRLMVGRPRAELEAALEWATQRVANAHRAPGAQVILYLYVSSHGDDGRGLELGSQTLAWADLKASLTKTNADVRVAFIDACNASGLLETGARATGSFEIRAEDRLTVSGEALITSSAADEPSLEAGAYKGGVFTHHLLGALRGAGDRSGDGQVSLEEAYRYAYARTVEGDSGQHPGYGFKLSGHGELFVSSPKSASAALLLPRNLDAVTVTAVDASDRFLELRQPEGRLLALPPGRWQLELWRGGQAKRGVVTLAAGSRLTVDEAEFLDAPAATAALVRLGSATRFCLDKVGAEASLSLVAGRLEAALKALPDHSCGEGAPQLTLRLSRERTQGIRAVGTVKGHNFELHTDESGLAAEVARMLKGT
jgi:hypothetical protein